MNDSRDNAMTHCCAECGNQGGGVAGLKVCKSCMLVKYCNAECQHKHWPTHKADCKRRAAEIRDEDLFKDPPPMEECPICFLPMPIKLLSCMTLPPATLLSVPIYDFANANKELAKNDMEEYYQCCGKSICVGCDYSFDQSGNDDKCPFCNSDRHKTEEELVAEIMKRVAANDAASICMLASSYYQGLNGLQRDQAKAMELFTKSAELGSSVAHNNLGAIYHQGGNLKKAKYHYEAAAMAGHEMARNALGYMEFESGNMERAIKHWTIAASAGYYCAMHIVRKYFEKGHVSRESIDLTLAAYNISCFEMRSEARDAYIRD